MEPISAIYADPIWEYRSYGIQVHMLADDVPERMSMVEIKIPGYIFTWKMSCA